MKFPRSLWLEILQEEVEEIMDCPMHSETNDVDEIFNIIIQRLEYAEKNTNRRAAMLLLHSEGLELV